MQTALTVRGGELFLSLLGGAAYAAVSRDFRSVLHLRFYQRVHGCQSSVLSAIDIDKMFSVIDLGKMFSSIDIDKMFCAIDM